VGRAPRRHEGKPKKTCEHRGRTNANDSRCIGSITLNQPFKVECIDYSGGQVCNDDHADDVLDLDHDTDHHMSGPFHVPGAEPGDILEIDILE